MYVLTGHVPNSQRPAFDSVLGRYGFGLPEQEPLVTLMESGEYFAGIHLTGEADGFSIRFEYVTAASGIQFKGLGGRLLPL